jgi:DNA-binding transcriptional MerR regulator
MYLIGELSDKAEIPTKTVRYYEEIGLLPEARRADNGYRLYDEPDIERLHFIKSARMLGFGLEDIREILAFREREEPPCLYVLNLMDDRIKAIEGQIRQLETLRDQLVLLVATGQTLPRDALMQNCVCHLIQESAGSKKGPYRNED